MTVYLESMTRVVHQLQPWEQVTIRVWRQESAYKDQETDNQNVADIIGAIQKIKKGEATKISIAEHILLMDRVNAVEVLDAQGHGPVIYKDWP